MYDCVYVYREGDIDKLYSKSYPLRGQSSNRPWAIEVHLRAYVYVCLYIYVHIHIYVLRYVYTHALCI